MQSLEAVCAKVLRKTRQAFVESQEVEIVPVDGDVIRVVPGCDFKFRTQPQKRN